MSDLDFIDQIVDQCLGAPSTPAQAAPRTPIVSSSSNVRVAPQQQQQQQPSSQFNNANNTMLNSSTLASPAPVAPYSSHGQPSRAATSAMPSPVPRDSHYNARSVPIGGGNATTNEAVTPFIVNGGYSTGGGRPEEYRGGNHEPQQFFGGTSGGLISQPAVGGDAALRRIQMWEEKKRLKQALAKREQESKGNTECTFHPDIQGARDSVLAHKLGLTSPKAQKGTVGFGYGGGNNGNATQRSILSAQSAMTPSKLYKDNKAWGYDSFIDRQLYAREMKRQAEEDAAAVFALKNPEGRNMRVTVPEPFEFGNKGRKSVRKALESPSATVAPRVKKEQTDFYYDDSSIYDPHHCSSGAYFNETSDYYTRQYKASDAVAAPNVPAGLFSLHASNMMLEYTPANPEQYTSSPSRR